jgi:hypothetical protein
MSFRPVTVRNLGGFFDTRAMPDEVGISNYTLLLNSSMRSRGKRCRRGGWKRLFDGVNDNYNNEDLHDQLLGLQFYYTDLSSVITTQETVGYQYPYWIPGTTNPTSFDDTFYGTQPQYWPDLVGQGYTAFDSGIEGWSFDNEWVGYPYTPCVDGVLPYYPGTTCQNSYADIYWRELLGGEVYAGYSYGTPVPVVTPARSYVYSYCDTYPYVRDGCNEAITMLNSIGQFDGNRILVAATRTRIYALNFATGNWKIVADGLGTDEGSQPCATCSQERWMSAVVQNVMVLTNGVNVPMTFNPIDGPTTCALWRAEVIADMDTLNVSSAGCVGSWKGFTFLGDVVQDGVRYRNRILWSDFNDPYTWVPADDNIAGFQDLGNDEIILQIQPLNDFCFIYTDRSIYRLALIATDPAAPTFAFEEIYRGDESLKYKYAFVNTGAAHIFWSENRVLQMTSFDKRPVEPDWFRAVSNTVFDGMSTEEISFDGLNEEQCDHFIGGYNPEFKEVWFSWPTGSNTCPNMSLVFNTTRAEEGADLVDQGFTAFHWYDGRKQLSIFEWWEDMQVCTRTQSLDELIKEGLPYQMESDPFDNPVSTTWNAADDWDAESDPNSLCRRMEEFWINVICSDCNTESRYVMAHADDKALKEYADRTYYRQELDGSLYVLNGYDTVIRSGQWDFKDSKEKRIRELWVQFLAEEQTVPNILYGYIGIAPSPGCITWKQIRSYDDCETVSEGISLACPTAKTAEEHEADYTFANNPTHFQTLLRSRYLSWKLKVTGTGGGVCFSQVALEVEQTQK